MLARIVKSKLALKGMTVKDVSEEINECYTSVYDVIHEKWGKRNGKVSMRILSKLSTFLDIDLNSVEVDGEHIQ